MGFESGEMKYKYEYKEFVFIWMGIKLGLLSGNGSGCFEWE